MSLDFNKDFDKKMTMCPLCDGADLQGHKIDYKGVKIEKCSSCDIEMMNPQYTDDYLNQYYSSYFDMETYDDDPKWGEALCEGHNFYLSLIGKRLPNDVSRRLW
ncbi:MAG TPA: hypothetical protein PKL31_01465 [Fulvivirga sp.]|nr:hypothetical protein [Fulvivirga sp.]